MKKKLFVCIVLILIGSVSLFGCSADSKDWIDNKDYDKALPNFENAGIGEELANQDGWYEVFTDNFEGDKLNSDIWTYSPHAKRTETKNSKHPEYTSYWCPDMVKLNNGQVEIGAIETNNHVCTTGICTSKVGRFTGGIETREVVSTDQNDNKGDKDNLIFSQAFGYFETRVKFPKGNGLWSAFWLQASTQRNVSNEGVDGTEIDVYESAFIKSPKSMGHALLWNGYGNKYSKVDDYITKTKTDLYDGYHTFAVKWTPSYYVFYIDGVATWATNGGGVSKVKEFLRLTVEIDDGDGYGPHGRSIGKFNNNGTVFYIDYVKVFQNKNYSKFEVPASYFSGDLNMDN